MDVKFNNELLIKGYNFLEDSEVIKACDSWLELWKEFKSEINNEKFNAIEDIDAEIETEESLVNWIQDLEMELENAGMIEKKYYDERIEFVKEFREKFPESDEFIIMNMKTAEAESLFELGNADESEKLFEKITKEHNSSVWPYVKWGDTKWLSGIKMGNVTMEDLKSAKDTYLKGKSVLDAEDYYILEDRLKEVGAYIK